MKTGLILKIPSVLALAALSYVSSSHASPVLVYDNLTTPALGGNSVDYEANFSTGSSEVGDEIGLAYNAIGTEFDLQYYFTGTPSPGPATAATAELRFYENDGPAVSGSPSPGTMVFDSGVFSMATLQTTRDVLAFDLTGATQVNAMNLSVPLTEFTWTIQFNGLSGTEDAGLTLYSPPTIGSNHPTYWENDAWQLLQVSGSNVHGPLPSDFGAQMFGVEVVPEPATMGVIGGLGMLVMMIRRRLA